MKSDVNFTDSCHTELLLGNFTLQCYADYSLMKKDTENYFPYWKLKNATSSHGTDPWKFTSSENSSTITLWGKVSLYGAGGYVLGLDNTRQKAMNHVLQTFSQGIYISFLSFGITPYQFVCQSHVIH